MGPDGIYGCVQGREQEYGVDGPEGSKQGERAGLEGREKDTEVSVKTGRGLKEKKLIKGSIWLSTGANTATPSSPSSKTKTTSTSKASAPKSRC